MSLTPRDDARRPVDDMIDWDLAIRTAERLLRPGPDVGWADAAEAVTSLRELAVEAEQHVVAVTGMAMPAPSPPVVVVDRQAWVRGNVEGFREVMTPVVAALASKRTPGRADVVTQAVGRRVTGVQVGTLLAFLAPRVLGQYEIFLPPQAGVPTPGRLSLVAPNIVETERALNADPRDFRLWVCLHEQTHRLQFTAVPWLEGFVRSSLDGLVGDGGLDPEQILARLRTAGSGLAGALRGGGGASLVELLQSPAQREVLDRVQGFMSLVEGHAEYVMDAAGPQVIPTLTTIRAGFDARRKGRSPVDRVLRSLLGLDLKMQQYAQGSRFVHAVVDTVGMEGFNAVWSDESTLPTRAEVRGPEGAAEWVARVHGPRHR